MEGPTGVSFFLAAHKLLGCAMPGWLLSKAGGAERMMVEDTMVTALRGAEGGLFVPTGRGALEVASTEKASWHFKVRCAASPEHISPRNMGKRAVLTLPWHSWP